MSVNRCLCGKVASHAQIRKEGKNQGRWFYGCGNYGTQEETCKHFKLDPVERDANGVPLVTNHQPVEEEVVLSPVRSPAKRARTTPLQEDTAEALLVELKRMCRTIEKFEHTISTIFNRL
jgi:ssDNA-binding Zn-finger/Zn-ribbon topoisomerase 1